MRLFRLRLVELRDAAGEAFCAQFLQVKWVKWAEWDAYAQNVSQWELDRYACFS